MPSLDRAQGVRGAAIALATALLAGCVHGVLAWQFEALAANIAFGLTGAVMLVIGGAVSARRSLAAALGLGLLMGGAFFLARWTGWALMEGGPAGVAGFIAAGPHGWPRWLGAHGVNAFWPVEAASMFAPALFGCYAGQERAPA